VDCKFIRENVAAHREPAHSARETDRQRASEIDGFSSWSIFSRNAGDAGGSAAMQL
jgi:hypothetical protein